MISIVPNNLAIFLLLYCQCALFFISPFEFLSNLHCTVDIEENVFLFVVGIYFFARRTNSLLLFVCIHWNEQTNFIIKTNHLLSVFCCCYCSCWKKKPFFFHWCNFHPIIVSFVVSVPTENWLQSAWIDAYTTDTHSFRCHCVSLNCELSVTKATISIKNKRNGQLRGRYHHHCIIHIFSTVNIFH